MKLLALALALVVSPTRPETTEAAPLVESASASASASARASVQSPSEREQRPTDYRIGPGDVLQILTWREDDFSGLFPVRYDGKISIPFVGDVSVAGQTPESLAAYLEGQIGRIVDSARVTVSVAEPNSAQFFILGKVQQQGAFPYTTPLRVVQALSLAGGFQEFAKLDQIFVIREVKGKLIYFPFNYDDLVNRRQLGGNLILLPGDTVVVP